MQAVHVLKPHESQWDALSLRHNIFSEVDDLRGLAVDVADHVGNRAEIRGSSLSHVQPLSPVSNAQQSPSLRRRPQATMPHGAASTLEVPRQQRESKR